MNKNVRVCLKDVALVRKTIQIPRNKCDAIPDMSGTIYVEGCACWFQIIQKTTTQYDMKFTGNVKIADAENVDVLYDMSKKQYMLIRKENGTNPSNEQSRIAHLFWMLDLRPEDAPSFVEIVRKYNPISLTCMLMMYFSPHDMSKSAIEDMIEFLQKL